MRWSRKRILGGLAIVAAVTGLGVRAFVTRDPSADVAVLTGQHLRIVDLPARFDK